MNVDDKRAVFVMAGILGLVHVLALTMWLTAGLTAPMLGMAVLDVMIAAIAGLVLAARRLFPDKEA